MHRHLASLLLIVAAASTTRAADPPREEAKGAASGLFESGGVKVPIVDAYAFRALGKDGDDARLTVAISNGFFPAELLGEYRDRKAVLDDYFKDDETALVYVDLTPAGQYRGVSYYLGPGNGCGYCSDRDEKSPLAVKAGRIVGNISSKTAERTVEITLDVPVASDEHGAALPAGSEPAKVYGAYQQAVKRRDLPAVQATLAESLLKRWADAEKEGRLEAFLANVLGFGSRPDALDVKAAYGTDERALLIVGGKTEYGDRGGEVRLRKEKAGWRIQEELLGSSFH